MSRHFKTLITYLYNKDKKQDNNNVVHFCQFNTVIPHLSVNPPTLYTKKPRLPKHSQPKEGIRVYLCQNSSDKCPT